MTYSAEGKLILTMEAGDSVKIREQADHIFVHIQEAKKASRK